MCVCIHANIYYIFFIHLSINGHSVVKQSNLILVKNSPKRKFPGMTSVSVQSLSCVRLFVTPRTAECQASLSMTNSRCPRKPMSFELVMPSNHLILCCPLLLLSSIFPSIKVFSNWVSSLHQVVKVLEFQLQHQSFQWLEIKDKGARGWLLSLPP